MVAEAPPLDPSFRLDLRELAPRELVRSVFVRADEPGDALRALANAHLPARTVAYAAAEHLEVRRPEARAGRYLADVVWADEVLATGAWHHYRGLRLAALLAELPWLGIATLADLRADLRVLLLRAPLPPAEELVAFWSQHRSAADPLFLLSWTESSRTAWELDASSLRPLAPPSRPGDP